MDRQAFLRGLAAGCPPTLSSQDLASELAEMSTYDDIRAGDAEILRQAAERLALCMTPQEIRAEATALRDTLGKGAGVSADISAKGFHSKEIVSVYVAPYGYGKDISTFYRADTYQEAFALAREGEAKRAITAHQGRVRKLALAIIEAKHTDGEATDILLRQRGFADDELSALHLEAEAMAGEMADGKPFVVVFTAGSNGAPAAGAAE